MKTPRVRFDLVALFSCAALFSFAPLPAQTPAPAPYEPTPPLASSPEHTPDGLYFLEERIIDGFLYRVAWQDNDQIVLSITNPEKQARSLDNDRNLFRFQSMDLTGTVWVNVRKKGAPGNADWGSAILPVNGNSPVRPSLILAPGQTIRSTVDARRIALKRPPDLALTAEYEYRIRVYFSWSANNQPTHEYLQTGWKTFSPPLTNPTVPR